jgi:glycerol-3-phosphate dehydrogenase
MPGLTSRCVYQFEDALVDDCRLTLRLIFEALDHFPDQVVALNHTKVASVERTSRGFSCRLVRSSSETPIDLETATVVLASGAANDQWQCLFDEKGVDDKATHIRPLRGSHLMFPAWTLPLTQAVVMAHPENHRPLFLIPWGGALMFGTTDLDHVQGAQEDVRMASEEVSYLMRALEDAFPDGRFRREQALSTFSGVRPVLEKPSQKKNQPPSALSREHGISSCRGVVAVTGGKLTTFRVMAAEVLRVIRGVHPQLFKGPWQESLLGKSTGFSQGPGLPGEVQCQAFHTLSSQSERRFMERFGSNYASWQTLGPLEKSLLYSAAFEKVQHLDDLLMRRTRLGLVAPSGGLEFLFPIKQNLMQILSWGDSRWDEECVRFGSRLERYYRLPGEPEDGERS